MKSLLSRRAYRPLLERLECRLQPGSLLAGPIAGWSLWSDRLPLSILSAPDTPPSGSAAPAHSNPPANPRSVLEDVHLATVSLGAATARHGSLTPQVGATLVDNLAADWTNGDLSSAPATGALHLLATEPLRISSQPPRADSPMGAAPSSPVGVASPTPVSPAPSANASAAASATALLHSANAGAQVRPVQPIALDHPVLAPVTGTQRMQTLHAVPIDITHALPQIMGGHASNQATLNFLGYVGNTGPDSLNAIAIRTENGANYIYLAGSYTDTTGRTDILVAKVTDGVTSQVWASLIVPQDPSLPGPDLASGLGLFGNSVYVAGSLTDPLANINADGVLLQLDATTGSVQNALVQPNAYFSAVTTELGSGTVYVAGAVGDPVTPHRQDLTVATFTSDLSTEIYFNAMFLNDLGPDTSSAVVTGGGVSEGPSGRGTGAALLVDREGNAYFAGVIGHPGGDVQPVYGRLDVNGIDLDWGFRTENITPGPGGIGTAVAFTEQGDVVFTGSLNDNTGTPLGQDLLLGRMNRQTGEITDANGQASAFFVDDRTAQQKRVGDWTGNDLLVRPDGSAIVTGAAFDPAAGTNQGNSSSRPTQGIDVHVTHFTPDDRGTVQNPDGDPENIFGGSGTDIGVAIAFDPNSPSSIYVVGVTTSTDLPTTPGVTSLTYTGTTSTGFVAQVFIP